LGDVDSQIFVFSGDGDGEPTQGKRVIGGSGWGHTGGEYNELSLGFAKTHAGVFAPLVQVGDGGLQLGQVLDLEGGGGGERSSGVGSNGPIIREEGGRDEAAVGVSGDGLLKAVDKY
jgi:hypothetical protein